MLFSPDDWPVLFNGRADTLERFASIRTRDHDRQYLFDVPVPLHRDEAQTVRHENWNSSVEFTWSRAIDRPVDREDETLGSEEVGWPWHRFLTAVAARMQDFEGALDDSVDPWSAVLDQWLDPRAEKPLTMDVVVRHARRHHGWSEIAERPRRLLNRRREPVHLSRVQELDTQCMQWLSRQPGRTLAERAGPRQEILALARFENRDTLENRVFRDLLERTYAASREYLATNKKPSTGARHSTRYAIAQQYGRECRRLAGDLAEEGVHRLPELVQPNYVLSHDHRYRYVWSAWQEIVRRERDKDDLWRWQRRSWAEFCKVTAVLSLLALPRSHLVAASPVFFRPEHRRGEWLLHDDPLAVVALEDEGCVVEVLSGDSPDVRDILKELCAAVWLRFSDFSGGEYKYLPLWAIHSFRADTTLSGLVELASEALTYLRGPSLLAGGLVCMSSLDPEAAFSFQRSTRALGFAFGPWDACLPDALERMGEEIAALIGAHV